MRIIFFGTSNVALPILEALSRKHEVAAVVTMPDAPVGRSQTMTESPVSVLANEMKVKVLKPEKVKDILEAKDRRLAGKTAPGRGLCLVRINF